MHTTRRWWTAALLALFVAGWAVLVERPAVLLGAAGIGGFLLATQLQFVATIARSSITVDYAPARGRATVGETVPVALTVETAGAAYSLQVTPEVPANVDADPGTLRLDRGTNRGRAILDCTLPIAGSVDLSAPTIVATDALGLYEQELVVDAGASIEVDPRQLDDLHVGTGGEPIAVAYGEHASGRLGSGLELAEIRRYVPGEAVRQMDWKATARRGEPHVREFEAETDRVTTLVLDVRDRMTAGPDGETKLDHLRQVALTFADRARSSSDPLGCYTVGDEGLTATFDASANASQQLAIRRHLTAAESTPAPATRSPDAYDPAAARRKRTRLGDDDFGRALAPFLDSPGAYVERIEAQPLFTAVRTLKTAQRGNHWTIILTDDSDRTELRKAVGLARAGGGNVLVFVTPSVLFEPGSLADLDAAYERYADFEDFRRTLAGMDRVQAFEVGPGDRLSQVLGAGRATERTRGES